MYKHYNFAAILLVLATTLKASAQSNMFDLVPKTDRAYIDYSKLVSRQITTAVKSNCIGYQKSKDKISVKNPVPKVELITRYEFAVGIDRALETYGKLGPKKHTQEIDEIFKRLQTEFRTELNSISKKALPIVAKP